MERKIRRPRKGGPRDQHTESVQRLYLGSQVAEAKGTGETGKMNIGSLAEAIRLIKYGNPFDKSTDQTNIIKAAHRMIKEAGGPKKKDVKPRKIKRAPKRGPNPED